MNLIHYSSLFCHAPLTLLGSVNTDFNTTKAIMLLWIFQRELLGLGLVPCHKAAFCCYNLIVMMLYGENSKISNPIKEIEKLPSYSVPLMLWKQHCSTENEDMLCTQCTEVFQGNCSRDFFAVQLKNTASTLRQRRNLFRGNYTSAVVQMKFIQKSVLGCFARIFVGSV